MCICVGGWMDGCRCTLFTIVIIIVLFDSEPKKKRKRIRPFPTFAFCILFKYIFERCVHSVHILSDDDSWSISCFFYIILLSAMWIHFINYGGSFVFFCFRLLSFNKILMTKERQDHILDLYIIWKHLGKSQGVCFPFPCRYW